MSVNLTEAAAKRVSDFIRSRGHGAGLRFGVKTTGCSGYMYVIGYADEIGADDHVFESHGVKVIVDPKSLDLVDGTEIDFRKDGLSESFQFQNPKVQDTCGCGESFNVD